MTLDELASWLDAYGRAWEAQDVEKFVGLFAPDARYWWGPFDAPLHGHEEIRERTRAAVGAQRDIAFGYEPLAVTPDGRGIARWWVSYRTVPAGVAVRDEGVFLVTLDDDGRCTAFREWWNELEARGEGVALDAARRAAVEEWVGRHVADGPNRAIEMWSQRPWSTVLRVDGADGRVWFKENAPVLRHEARLLPLVHELAPELVPPPIAVDERRGWLLLPDAGVRLREAIRSDRDLGHWETVLRAYARLQQRSAEAPARLLANGAHDRRAGSLPAQLEGLLARPVEGLARDTAAELAAALPRFAAECDELDALGPPDALFHDDFHDANVFVERDRYSVLDWAESGVGHPFLGLGLTFRATAWSLGLDEDGPELRRLREAYLDCWRDWAPRGRLERALALADRVHRVTRALTWHLVASATPVDGDDREAAAEWLRRYAEDAP